MTAIRRSPRHQQPRDPPSPLCAENQGSESRAGAGGGGQGLSPFLGGRGAPGPSRSAARPPPVLPLLSKLGVLSEAEETGWN